MPHPLPAHLVCTPAGKVHVPVMEMQLHVPNGMSEVKPNLAPFAVGGFCDGGHVVALTCEVMHTWSKRRTL